jgi:hypothetical protein
MSFYKNKAVEEDFLKRGQEKEKRKSMHFPFPYSNGSNS